MDPKFLYTLGEKQNGTFFMYDQTTCKKGANEVVSFLQYYIENVLGPDIKILYLFSNNCYAQNKNHALVRYLATLCFTERFDVIMHRFPEPGHNFLLCDRFLGIIEKKKRYIDRIFLPQEYMEIVKSSSRKFHVIPVTHTMVLNYTDHLKSFFYPYPKSRSKEKFGISSYRVFKYTKNGEVACTHSASANAPLINFVLLRSNANPTLNGVEQVYLNRLLSFPERCRHANRFPIWYLVNRSRRTTFILLLWMCCESGTQHHYDTKKTRYHR